MRKNILFYLHKGYSGALSLTETTIASKFIASFPGLVIDLSVRLDLSEIAEIIPNTLESLTFKGFTGSAYSPGFRYLKSMRWFQALFQTPNYIIGENLKRMMHLRELTLISDQRRKWERLDYKRTVAQYDAMLWKKLPTTLHSLTVNVHFSGLNLKHLGHLKELRTLIVNEIELSGSGQLPVSLEDVRIVGHSSETGNHGFRVSAELIENLAALPNLRYVSFAHVVVNEPLRFLSVICAQVKSLTLQQISFAGFDVSERLNELPCVLEELTFVYSFKFDEEQVAVRFFERLSRCASLRRVTLKKLVENDERVVKTWLAARIDE
jgi:hypothetical protein